MSGDERNMIPSATDDRAPAPGKAGVARLGVMTAGILLVAIVGVLATAAWVQKGRQEQAAVRRVREVVRTLAGSAEGFLATNDLPSLQRTVSRVAAEQRFALCRVTIPGSPPIADAAVGHTPPKSLPASWPSVAE